MGGRPDRRLNQSVNDLGGILLTVKRALAARTHLLHRIHWPSMPELSEPWYGQFH
jgi:hypothetical protein